MREEISNAEVDRILQQLRQEQPSAAAEDPVESILQSLGVEPTAGQGKRRLHEMAQQSDAGQVFASAGTASNELSFHRAGEQTVQPVRSVQQPAAAARQEPAPQPKRELAPQPKQEPAAQPKQEPMNQLKQEPMTQPKREPEPQQEPAPQPKTEEPATGEITLPQPRRNVVVDENFRRFFTQTLDNLEEPTAARSRREPAPKKEKREKKSLLRRRREQPKPAEEEWEAEPQPQPAVESRPEPRPAAPQPAPVRQEQPEEDQAPTRPFELNGGRPATAPETPAAEDTGEFSMPLDQGAWSGDDLHPLPEQPGEQPEPQPAPEPAEEPQTQQEPTVSVVPDEEDEPEEPEEQEEYEEPDDQPRKKFGHGLLSRLRLLGSQEEEEPDEEEPEEEPEEEEPEDEESQDEDREEKWQELEDYTAPDQAQKVMNDLSALSLRFVLRAVLTGVLAAMLLWMGVGATGLLLLPAVIDPVGDPLPFLTVNLLLCAAAVLVSFSTIKEGVRGLFGEPSADTMPALAAIAALVQALVLLLVPADYDPGLLTLFSGIAVLGLCTNAVGKLVHNQVVLRNFEMASSRIEHWAACMVTDKSRLSAVARGMDEPEPRLLVSRPTALVRDFLKHSFSSRASQRTARKLSYLLLAVAVLCALVGGFMAKSAAIGVSVLAAVLCLGAPFASTLLAAVPSLLMQKSAGKVGAVVPGWDAVEALGETNMVLVGAKDIFPASSIVLKGIKTFEKERIDLAILYAASILIEGCDTLRDVFSHIIEGRTDILYPVESMTREVGYGYSAWINEERVLVGNRDMMLRHGLAVPSLDWEARCSKNGERQLLYLAVSGKLFGVFGICYKANPEVHEVLESLNRRGISLLVKSDDCCVTSQLISQIYQLPEGCVKVLSEAERTALSPELIFRPESEGVMTHIGSFASFVGGLRAAEGAAAGEKLATMVQKAAVVFSCLVGLLLTITGGIIGLALPAVLLYQAAWTVLQLAVPLGKAS